MFCKSLHFTLRHRWLRKQSFDIDHVDRCCRSRWRHPATSPSIRWTPTERRLGGWTETIRASAPLIRSMAKRSDERRSTGREKPHLHTAHAGCRTLMVATCINGGNDGDDGAVTAREDACDGEKSSASAITLARRTPLLWCAPLFIIASL